MRCSMRPSDWRAVAVALGPLRPLVQTAAKDRIEPTLTDAARSMKGRFAFPNGMVVTPDGMTLLCAESYNGRLTAFDIAPDGSLSNQRLLSKEIGQ